MNYKKQIFEYKPINEQETQDKKIILNYIEKYSQNVLLRENKIAHITSSGFILNESLNKILMVHHNLRNTWSWTGGHVDGNNNFLEVAIKEAKEETGIIQLFPLVSSIASLDILPVYSHKKLNKYINAHLHLSIGYILIGSDEERLRIKHDENSDIKWFKVKEINKNNFSDNDIYLYKKLINKSFILKKN